MASSIVVPMLAQGLVTVSLRQFVAVHHAVRSGQVPITLGLYTFLGRGAGDADLLAGGVTG